MGSQRVGHDLAAKQQQTIKQLTKENRIAQETLLHALWGPEWERNSNKRGCMCMHVCVCVCICVSVYVHTYMYMHVCVYVCIYI